MARRAVVIGLIALSVVLARLPGHSAHASTSVPPMPLGQPGAGDLDRTFGGDGTVITDFGGLEVIDDLAVQKDGKIVAVGTTWNPQTQACSYSLPGICATARSIQPSAPPARSPSVA